MAQGTTKGVPIDTDPLLAADSDLLVPSQKAIKTYVDNSNVNQVTSVSGSAPIASTGGTTPVISIPQSSGATDGYLSSTDWTTFNNKVAATRSISTTAPLAGGGDLSADRTLSITQAATATDGYLSSTDWNTFNGKIGSDATLLGYNGLGSAIKAYPLGINLTAVGGSLAFTDARLWLIPVYVGANSTITGVKWYQVTQGAYTGDNYNGVGLYSISGGTLTLVASSTDDPNIWKTAASASWGSKAFSTSPSVNRGTYYIGALANATATITSAVGAVTIGAATLTGFDFTASRMYCYLAAQATLPASIALSGTVSLGTSALYFSLY